MAFGALALALVLLSGAAQAQSFNPGGLAAQDRQEIQRLLEEEHTNVPRTLPASGDIFTITRTETQPRICRHFVIQSDAGGQRRGVGCRISALNWELAADLSAIAEAPTIPTDGSSGTVPRPTTAPGADIRPAPTGPNPGLNAGSAGDAVASLPITPFLEIEPRPIPIRRGGTILPFALVPERMRGVPTPLPRPEDLAGATSQVAAAPSSGGTAVDESVDGPVDEPVENETDDEETGEVGVVTPATDAPTTGSPNSADGEAPDAGSTAPSDSGELPELNPSRLSEAVPASPTESAEPDEAAGETVAPEAPASAGPIPAQMATVPLPVRRPAP